MVKGFGCAVGVVGCSEFGIAEGAGVFVRAWGCGGFRAGAVVGCAAAMAVVDDGGIDESSDKGQTVSLMG